MRWVVAFVLGGCDAVLGLDTVTPAPCGVVGAACCESATCNDGSLCMTPVTGPPRCTALAGLFQTTHLPSACGEAACLAPNPYTGGCSCPSSFGVAESASLDQGCGSATAPANAAGDAQICAVPSHIPGSNWGGAYLGADIPACEPGTTPAGCIQPNPLTMDCSCPAGADAIMLRVFVEGIVNGTTCVNGWLGGTLGICLFPGTRTPEVLGVYQVDAQQACRYSSSGLAGCSCPAGAVEGTLRSIQESATTMFSLPETSIVVCLSGE